MSQTPGLSVLANPPLRFPAVYRDYCIGALLHSDYVADLVRHELGKVGLNVRTCVTTFESALDDAQRLLDEGCEALLCHGASRHLIFQKFWQQAVFIERSDIDLIKALLDARKVSREVVLTAFSDEVRDFELMEQLLDMRIHPLIWNTWEQIHEGLRRLCDRGVTVAVGGGNTARIMAELGGRTFLDAPLPHNIRNAAARAVMLARSKRTETAHRSDLLEIMQHLREGVVCVDDRGGLTYCNSLAKKLLRLADERECPRWYPELCITRVLNEGLPCNDMLVSVHGRRLLVSAFPLCTGQERSGHKASGVVALFHDVAALQKINRKIDDALYSKGFVARYRVEDILGQAPGMVRLRERTGRYARTDMSVHITGETGCGKELVAHALHTASPRRDKPFMAVNCSALTESLLESELFGYEEGAFTGAKRGGKPGLFELAHGGTLFLDEIGEMSPFVQLRLLRVLESKEVMRIGGDRLIPVDVRVLSATHKSLTDMITEGKFRRDLYYRLVNLTMQIPPLRERLEDIPALIAPLLRRYGKTTGVLSPAIRRHLTQYAWPGNVRELSAVMESYCALLPGDEADETCFFEVFNNRHLRGTGTGPAVPPDPGSGTLRQRLAKIRSALIEQSILEHGGNKAAAARALGMGYATLRRLTENAE